MSTLPLIAIIGPTASGKTRRAVEVARAFGGEIVSGDSRQVYRGMDIGTGKDLAEYGSVPVHMLDVVDAGTKYDLFQYLRDAQAAIDAIRGRGATPVLCGGSGMYVESILKGVRLPEVPPDQEYRASLRDKSLDELSRMLAGIRPLHNTTDTDTPARAIRALEIERYYAAHPDEARAARGANPPDAVIIGVSVDRDTRRARISARLRHRLQEEDMLGEVERLLDAGVAAETLIYYGLEYKFLTLHLLGQLSYSEMTAQLETAIHQFAKRQMTWFRGMERRGFHIDWLDGALPPDGFTAEVAKIIAGHGK